MSDDELIRHSCSECDRNYRGCSKQISELFLTPDQKAFNYKFSQNKMKCLEDYLINKGLSDPSARKNTTPGFRMKVFVGKKQQQKASHK